MGAGGMKHRPVRLIFTILLSFVAFALFGLADTMAAYDRNTTVIDSIADSSMQALAVGVKLRSEQLHYGANGQLKDKEVYYSQPAGLSDEDLRTLEAGGAHGQKVLSRVQRNDLTLHDRAREHRGGCLGTA